MGKRHIPRWLLSNGPERHNHHRVTWKIRTEKPRVTPESRGAFCPRFLARTLVLQPERPSPSGNVPKTPLRSTTQLTELTRPKLAVFVFRKELIVEHAPHDGGISKRQWKRAPRAAEHVRCSREAPSPGIRRRVRITWAKMKRCLKEIRPGILRSQNTKRPARPSGPGGASHFGVVAIELTAEDVKDC
jgi:hypothetical protein